ncbi:MAG: chromosomal replication initiator protein DnaA [Solobacterium sp.]|nr:chromosomal replication initiator protein DnaA [Solobacterium sp.]
MTHSRDQYFSDVWNQTLNYLINNRKIEPEIINAFYRTSSLAELNDSKAIVIVPNIIARQIVGQSADVLKAALIDLLSLDHSVSIEVMQENEFEKKKQENDLFDESFLEDEEFESMPIQPERTFDNFVVGDCNRESQAASLACALNPGKYFNPLFIYGNSGLGKTHLLMAIGNYVKKAYPNKKVYYIESLKFVDKVVRAIQKNKIDYFKQYMCSMDVLLVDDIQFLAGKEKSHEIFFTIYNELVNNRKQICIASDRQPKEIKGLEDRLISRFSSGLSVGIDSPEFETSLAILRMKIKNSGNDIEDVDENGLAYIASNFSGNVRDLEGAWNRVLFYAIMFQEDKNTIRFETVVNALKNQAVVSDKTGLSPGKVIKAVADYYGLTKQQITGKTRTKNIAGARHISIYLCRKLLDLPYIKIGEEFGGRDHSTIISACAKVEKQMHSDAAMAAALEEIEKSLGM